MSKLKGEHRSQKDGFWLWCGKAEYYRAGNAAGASGVAVYTALCLLESNAPPEHKSAFHASAGNIAKVSWVSTRTVATVLPKLVKAKLVEMVSGRSQRAANKYRLTSATVADAAIADAKRTSATIASAKPVSNGCRQKRYSFSEGDKEKDFQRKQEKDSPAASSPSEALPSGASEAGGTEPSEAAPPAESEDHLPIWRRKPEPRPPEPKYLWR